MASNIIELHTQIPADLEGNVFGQSIKAGEKVTTGKTVTINVKKSNTTSETTSATKATTSASNATTKAN